MLLSILQLPMLLLQEFRFVQLFHTPHITIQMQFNVHPNLPSAAGLVNILLSYMLIKTIFFLHQHVIRWLFRLKKRPICINNFNYSNFYLIFYDKLYNFLVNIFCFPIIALLLCIIAHLLS